MPVDILKQKDIAINWLSLVTKLQPPDSVIISYSGSEIIVGFSHFKKIFHFINLRKEVDFVYCHSLSWSSIRSQNLFLITPLQWNNLSIAPGINISHPSFSGKQWTALCGRHIQLPTQVYFDISRVYFYNCGGIMYIFMRFTERGTVGLGRYSSHLGPPSSLLAFYSLAGLFSDQRNTCMAVAARASRIYPKSRLFFQMQVINPDTVLISFTEIYIFFLQSFWRKSERYNFRKRLTYIWESSYI